MDESRFRIVFEKLSQVTAEERSGDGLLDESGELTLELEAISELRRLSLEIAEPEPITYTTT